MSTPAKTLEIRSSPHVLSGHGVDTIQFNVALALLPTIALAVWVFGLATLAVLATALVTCWATEYLLWRYSAAPLEGGHSPLARSPLADLSVTVTALLFALTLPPGLPLWMVAVGALVAVVLGKALFGGLGQNPFNPALVGRAFLQAAFPAAMTTWYPAQVADRFTQLPSSTLAWPLSRPAVDGLSGATPLARFKLDGQGTPEVDLALGWVSGSLGETSALAIALGGCYLVARNFMGWRIPLATLGTVAVVSAGLHHLDPGRYASPTFMLCSGGLMLGAVFMATDPVASPMTPKGHIAYGVLIAMLVVVIRTWGGMPEGVMVAILLANAVSPHLDAWTRPTVYGTRQSAAPGGGS